MATKKTNKKSKDIKTSVKKTTKKVETPVVEPAPVPATAPAPVKTEAEKIWDEIKNRPIQMFGLPDQTIFQHCAFVKVEPSSLYVSIRSTATLPSLESAIGPDYVVELADKFVIVKRAPKPLIPSKR